MEPFLKISKFNLLIVIAPGDYFAMKATLSNDSLRRQWQWSKADDAAAAQHLNKTNWWLGPGMMHTILDC